MAVGVPGSLPSKPVTAIDLVDKAVLSDVKLVQIADNLSLENFTSAELKSLITYAGNKNVSFDLVARTYTRTYNKMPQNCRKNFFTSTTHGH